eukprot:6488283-Amphidinium_carterae.1
MENLETIFSDNGACVGRQQRLVAHDTDIDRGGEANEVQEESAAAQVVLDTSARLGIRIHCCSCLLVTRDT